VQPLGNRFQLAPPSSLRKNRSGFTAPRGLPLIPNGTEQSNAPSDVLAKDGAPLKTKPDAMGIPA